MRRLALILALVLLASPALGSTPEYNDSTDSLVAYDASSDRYVDLVPGGCGSGEFSIFDGTEWGCASGTAVVTTDGASSFLELRSSVNAQFKGYSYQGTAASKSATTTANVLVFLTGSGYNGSAQEVGGHFSLRPGSTWSGTNEETYGTLYLTGASETSPTESFRFERDSSGNAELVLLNASVNDWRLRAQISSGRFTIQNENSSNQPFKIDDASVDNALRIGLDSDNTEQSDVVSTVTGTDFQVGGFLRLPDPTELTLDANGSITVTGSFHTVDTYGDAGSDDLEEILGGTEGAIVCLHTVDSSRDVDVLLTNNVIPPVGGVTLTTPFDVICLVYSEAWAAGGYDGRWSTLSFSNNY